MGGLTRVSALLLAPALLAAADPEPACLKVRLPGGGRTALRLVFRKGLQAEAQGLPPAFLARKAEGAWVPFEGLSPEGKRWALQSLFPEDAWRKDGVRHVVRWPQLESVWLLSVLFTGHGQNYDRLQALNPGCPEKLRKGDVWRVPMDLLSAELGGRAKGLPVRSTPEDDLDDEARVAAYRALLTYGEDAEGRYAAYRLRKGEALYSSVVMRYTDRVEPKEVNELAAQLARRSGIQDLRSIPPGTLVKTPVDALADPFQPEGSEALREEREVREEVRRTARVEAGPRLKGVRIVLDPGHGGVDVGAMANGVWESDYVYDIVQRVRRLLEQRTEARVSCTVRYPSVGFRVRDRILKPTRAAEFLTTPPYASDGEGPLATSVHLRWVLANDLARPASGDRERTLFLSFHADSLHPSARGAMAYVPGAAQVPASFRLSPARGGGVAEMKRSAGVAFTAKDKLRGEARSRQLAEALLKAVRAAELPIHANRPIRNVIHRGGKSYVPAVLRYSSAGAKVLVEVLNLTNDEDAELLKDPRFRERFAEAVVQGIGAFFRR